MRTALFCCKTARVTIKTLEVWAFCDRGHEHPLYYGTDHCRNHSEPLKGHQPSGASNCLSSTRALSESRACHSVAINSRHLIMEIWTWNCQIDTPNYAGCKSECASMGWLQKVTPLGTIQCSSGGSIDYEMKAQAEILWLDSNRTFSISAGPLFSILLSSYMSMNLSKRRY